MLGLSVQFDLGNWKRVLHGMHVQRRVLGRERRDVLGVCGWEVQDASWSRGVHCVCCRQDAGNAGGDGGEHVPDVRGRQVLGAGGERRVRQLRSGQVLCLGRDRHVRELRARQISGIDWERCRVGLRAVLCRHVLRSGRGKRHIDMPKLSLGDKLCCRQ